MAVRRRSNLHVVRGSSYAALYHSFSLGRNTVAPAFRVMLLPLLGVGVPPHSV